MTDTLISVLSLLFGMVAGLALTVLSMRGPMERIGRLANAAVSSLLTVICTAGALPLLAQTDPAGPWRDQQFVGPILAGFAIMGLVGGYIHFSPEKWTSHRAEKRKNL